MRTVAIVIDSRANWSRGATILEALDKHPDINCQFIVCSKFSNEWQYTTDRKPQNVLETYVEGDTTEAMAHSASSLIHALIPALTYNKPDVVITLTDRYETLCVAVTAALLNIHVAHVQGGEVTGTIDESIRHSVTKLSQIHFAATDEARDRIIGMGEDSRYVYNVGCPASDLLMGVDTSVDPSAVPYILVLYHPVTTEHTEAYQQMKQVLEGVKAAWDGLVVVVGPNHDAGNYGVWQAIKESGYSAPSNIPHAEFVNLMAHAEVVVGNSSAGIREACYFGTPVVDVGTRQKGRKPRSIWTVNCVAVSRHIDTAIKITQLNGRQEPEYLYGDGTAGQQIADILAEIELPNIQKRFVDNGTSS